MTRPRKIAFVVLAAPLLLVTVTVVVNWETIAYRESIAIYTAKVRDDGTLEMRQGSMLVEDHAVSIFDPDGQIPRDGRSYRVAFLEPRWDWLPVDSFRLGVSLKEPRR